MKIRGFIHQLEEKCGKFFSVVMIIKAHLKNENKYDKDEGNIIFSSYNISTNELMCQISKILLNKGEKMYAF